MLNVWYNEKYGHIDVLGSDGKTIFKSLIHPCNALFSCVYHDKKNKLAHLVTYTVSFQHLKNCLKDNLNKENFKKIVIYINTNWKERFKVTELFQKYGYNVEMKVCKRWKRNEKKKTISK